MFGQKNKNGWLNVIEVMCNYFTGGGSKRL